MIPRQCPECGGELVLARRSDEQGARFNARPSNYWRCSTCGGEFTAEQVRGNKQSKSRDILTRARLTAMAMIAAPHEWLTKAALTTAQACRMPPDIQSMNRELSQWGRHLEGAT